MSKVIMTCGKICTGKTTYAKKLKEEYKAVILSVDEITLALFENGVGDKHDEYVEKAEKYLFEKSLEIVGIGVNIILDWGFWQKSEREYARKLYKSNNVEYEFHYIDISDDEWKKRLDKRNRSVSLGEASAYYVDEGLAEKCVSFFEKPDESETDVYVIN